MRLKLIKGDITTIECDAIVCSTNKSLIPAGCVDSAIHEAAGKSLTMECALIAPCYVGDCIITQGYNLPSKHVIHTVPPHVTDNESAHWLAQCYKKAIQKAIQKRYSSIAFPLLGSGSNGFPVEKALDIALNRLDSSRRDTRYMNFDLLVYLVLFDEDTWSLAVQYADDKKIDLEIELSNSEVLPVDKHWVSLCKVNRIDKNGQIWMVRIADLEAGNLTAHTFDPNKPSSFENRRLLFRNDGPNTVNSIGFWRWHEVEKPAGSGQWRSISQYIEEMTPIEIIDLGTQTSLRDVIDKLKTGLNIPVYIQGNILFISTIDQKLIGIFCNLKDFDVGKVKAAHDVFISIKKTKYTLPYYSINEENIISWDYRKVYSHISMGEPIGMATLQIPVDAIRQILLDRFTNWPVFKAQGISKGDWQKFKEFLRSIPVETLYSELSSAYGMSLEEVANCIDGFLKSAESYIDATDIDSLLFPQLIDNHKVIRDLLYEKAEEKWREENKKALEQAEKRLAEIRLDTDQEQRTAKQQLANVHKEITTAKEQHDDILNEIESAKNELEQLRISIRENEILGNNTVSAIRQRITDAQKDMAGFIADLSVFLPQAQAPIAVESKSCASLWQYECAPGAVYAEEDVDLAENWGDELNAIAQNLAHSMALNGDFGGMLSAFLYATHINKIPLLIAGPSGRELSEIMAVSLYASGAGHLWLGNEPANNIAETVAGYDECIISVQNMFGKGWQDELPQSFAKLNKQVIWTHPYAEDLVIEPKGLLNYMLPVLSECFVESIPTGEPWPTKQAEKFKAYTSTKQQPLKIAAFKKLKLSKLLTNRLIIALSDAKAILNQPAKDKDMEILFGLLPLCVITGRIDILKEAIETESGISSAVKAEANRYIEEE